MRALHTREIIAYQIRQSFKPGEITPDKANAIGYETAMRFTKGKYAFTVSTHVDKAHIHNHIIFNAKQLSKTILFLQEHRISSSEELKELTDDHIKTLQNLTDSMKEKEAYLKENKRLQKAIVDYAKNRKVFETYKKSGYRRAFREKHQQELLTYEAAVEVYKSTLLQKRSERIPDCQKKSGDDLSGRTRGQSPKLTFRERVVKAAKSRLSDKRTACHERF